MNTDTLQPHTLSHTDTASTILSLFGAALLGAVIIFGIGFSHSDTIHNAAHDMRHSNAFPCH